MMVPGSGQEPWAREKQADSEGIYEVDTPGIGGHQKRVRERGAWCGQLLVFDASHVTSFFILAMMPRGGDTIIIPTFQNRKPGFGRGRDSWPASAPTSLPPGSSCPSPSVLEGRGLRGKAGTEP